MKPTVEVKHPDGKGTMVIDKDVYEADKAAYTLASKPKPKRKPKT